MWCGGGFITRRDTLCSAINCHAHLPSFQQRSYEMTTERQTITHKLILKADTFGLPSAWQFRNQMNRNSVADLLRAHNVETYRIRFRTSCGSGGFGRLSLHIATKPATMTEVMTTPAAAATAANITICECCFCLSALDVSAGVGSSEMMVSSTVWGWKRWSEWNSDLRIPMIV